MPTVVRVLEVKIDPMSQRTSTLTITDDAPGSPQIVSLSAVANPAVTVSPAPGGSTSASVTAGQSAIYQLQITPGSGFTGTVSLACSGAPVGATCSIPSTVSLTNGNAAPFTVTVITTAKSSVAPPANRAPDEPPLPWQPVALSWIALLPALILAQHSLRETSPLGNRVRHPIPIALVLILSFILAGCGAGSGAPPPPPIFTPAGTYAITLTPPAVASGSTQQLQLNPIQLSLTVK